MNEKKNHILIIFALFLTLIYILLSLLGFAGLSLQGTSILGYVVTVFTTFLGLFVPFGIWNTIFSGGIGLALYIPLLIYVDKLIRESMIPNWRKYLYAFAFLFVCTFFAELMIWGTWQSGVLFLNNTFHLSIPGSQRSSF